MSLLVDQVLQLLFGLLARGIIWVRPALPAVCFVVAWSTVGIVLWNIVKSVRSGIKSVRQLHRIPCASCQYATNSHHLKCSVQPSLAFSEAAVGCMDFESVDSGYSQVLSKGAH